MISKDMNVGTSSIAPLLTSVRAPSCEASHHSLTSAHIPFKNISSSDLVRKNRFKLEPAALQMTLTALGIATE